MPVTRAPLVTVDDAGRAVAVRGDPNHPTTAGGSPTFYDCLVEISRAKPA